MSKDFTRTCKMFPKRTTQEKILQISNYMVEEDIYLMTLLLSTRKNSDNVKYEKEVLSIGLDWH